MFIACPKRRMKVIASQSSHFIKFKMASSEQHKHAAKKKNHTKLNIQKNEQRVDLRVFKGFKFGMDFLSPTSQISRF